MSILLQIGIKSPEAYKLKDKLLRDYKYAYRKDDDLLRRVSVISDGSGHADMIQDLNDLSKLGRENPEPLKKINFDMSLLDKAVQTSDEMASLHAKANAERGDDKNALLIRNKAFTYLKKAVDEVRACGKFVFYDNKKRKKGYISNYKRTHRGSSGYPDDDFTALFVI